MSQPASRLPICGRHQSTSSFTLLSRPPRSYPRLHRHHRTLPLLPRCFKLIPPLADIMMVSYNNRNHGYPFIFFSHTSFFYTYIISLPPGVASHSHHSPITTEPSFKPITLPINQSTGAILSPCSSLPFVQHFPSSWPFPPDWFILQLADFPCTQANRVAGSLDWYWCLQQK